MKNITRLAAIIAALFTVTLAAQAQDTVPTSTPSATTRGPQVGEMAPDFTVIGPDGREMKLSDFRGKTVLVDIWATWCGPCVASMPHNSELAETYAKDGLVILAVCADDTRANYDGWVKRNSKKYKFLTAHDPAGKKDWDNSVFNTKYAVSGFPTLFLIDKEGKLVGSTAGGGPGENPYVTRLLAKGGVPIDTSHLPPEVKRPASVPMVGKTMATSIPAMTKTAAIRIPTTTFGTLKYDDEVADFSAVGTDGQDVKLSSFQGKPLLVVFWSGVRSPADDVAKLAATYQDQNLAVWAINVATDRASFDAWAKENASSLGYTVSWDPAGKAFMEAISNINYGIGMYPASMVVNADGYFRGGIIGQGGKVNTWVRQSLERAGIKLTAEDQASVKAAMDKLTADQRKAAPMALIKPSPEESAAPAKRIDTLVAGAIAPDFPMKDIDGNVVRLSDFKGKVVVLDFWATWCGPCIGSFPHTQKLAAKYKDQDVVVLASGTSDKIARFQEWIPENQSKYPDIRFAYDEHERETLTFEDRASSKLYGVRGIPTQFVVGRDGKIIGVIVGNGGENDARTEMALAKAGIEVDAATLAKGKAQLEKAAAPKDGKLTPALGLQKPKLPYNENYGKLKNGQTVPDFTVITPEGKEAKFSDYAKGKTVILDFWATWCGPCQMAMPGYEKISRDYADQDVVVVGVCSFDTRANYDKWLVENKGKYTFATVFDPIGKPTSGDKESYKKTIMMQLGNVISPLPTTLVVNPEGQLVGSYIGYGEKSHEALGNLLMRSGVDLAPADRPKTVAAAMMVAKKPAAPSKDEAATPPATLDRGATAPDFVMNDINGKEIRLSDYKGKVVILDFWATWCGPCIASMPHTNELGAKYKDQGVVVVASGTSDTIKNFKKWIPKNQPKYENIQLLFDPNERGSATFADRASQKLYGVTGIPCQFVIGRDGVITATIVGFGGKDDARTEAALARAGVKVDAARAASGEDQLTSDAEEAADRAAAAEEERRNPTPHFVEVYGKLKKGEPVPDFTAELADGQPCNFSELIKGKTTVFVVWAAGYGVPKEMLASMETLQGRYADQGLQFVGLGSFGARDAFNKWYADNSANFTFPVLFDPAGASPRPPKDNMDDMTDAEKAAFRTESSAYFKKIIPMAFTGGAMAPIPNTTVIDSQGKMVGFYAGAGPATADSLSNLLLRAGIKLAPEDMPRKVFTEEETKPKAPEARVELLKVGATAPDFKATDAAGKEVKISDYRGKVVILDFWATWCGPCIASMPHTQEVAKHYKDQGVVVIASCTSDKRKSFETWVKRNQSKYPDINFSHDPAERSSERASHKLYGVGGIPQQFVIDREGKVVALVTGYLKGEALLDAALAKAGIEVDPALIEKAAADLKKRASMR